MTSLETQASDFKGRRRTTCSAVPVVMAFIGTTDSRLPGLVGRQSGGSTPSSNRQESWHSVNVFYCTCALPSHLKSRHLELEESVRILIGRAYIRNVQTKFYKNRFLFLAENLLQIARDKMPSGRVRTYLNTFLSNSLPKQ